jgi:predicted nucleotidyltransferase
MSTAPRPGEIAVYRAAHRRQRQQRITELAAWRMHLDSLARRAAALLKAEFGTTEVWLFGSLVRQGLVDERSDVDLAVGGLNERAYLSAVSRLLDLDPRVAVDLVRIEEAPASLLAELRTTGRLL